MVAITLLIASLFLLWVVCSKLSKTGGGEETFLIWLAGVSIVALFWVAAFIPICFCTGGLMQGYSVGQREGYVTKISRKGFFWKTDEVEVQIGTGAQAALQAPHAFSVVDTRVLEAVKAASGRRVIVNYTEWLIQPAWRGGSGYEITSIEERPEPSK